MKLTQAIISAIERKFVRSRKPDRIVFDDELKGFGLRLQGNKRTWIVQYRVGHRQARVTIGTTAVFSANEARQLARHELATIRAARLGSGPPVVDSEPQATIVKAIAGIVGLESINSDLKVFLVGCILDYSPPPRRKRRRKRKAEVVRLVPPSGDPAA